MDVSQMGQIIQEALGRVEAVIETLGEDLLGIGENLAKELKDMGYDLVRAAETGQEPGDTGTGQ